MPPGLACAAPSSFAKATEDTSGRGQVCVWDIYFVIDVFLLDTDGPDGISH
jgi:hypothetical protein